MQTFNEEFMNSYTDTSDYTEVHYSASTIGHILHHNTRRLDGIFKSYTFQPREAEILI